jgi:WD40 repeat protein
MPWNTGHSNITACLTPDGNVHVRFLTGLHLWDLESGQSLQTRARHLGFIFALSLTPDGKCAVSGASDGSCILWDLKRGQALKKLKGHTNWVWAVA